MRILSLMSIVLLMTGCAGMNEFLYQGKCTSGDWKTIGFEDGKRGSGNSVGSWTSRCSQFNTQPDTVAYEKGYKKGKVQYCRAQGQSLGAQGKTDIPGNCLGDAESSAFLSTVKRGASKYCRSQGRKWEKRAWLPMLQPNAPVVN